MIWLIGCNGSTGNVFEKILKKYKMNIVATGDELDITDPQSIDNFEKNMEKEAYLQSVQSFKDKEIRWIINASIANKYNLSSVAESEREDFENYCTKGTLNIARLARRIGAKLIQVSSAGVFDGKNSNPYSESDLRDSEAFASKVLSNCEDIIAKEMNQYYIFRTSLLYGENTAQDFISSINKLNDLLSNEDFFVNPTNIENLAEIIIKFINKSETSKALFGKNSAPSYGVYNFADEGNVLVSEFIAYTKECIRKYKKNMPMDSENQSNPKAKSNNRLNYTINCEKVRKEMKIKGAFWQSTLEKYIKSLNQ